MFFLAGFAANAERWAAFTQEWGQALHNILQKQSLHTTDYLTNNGEHYSKEFDLEERHNNLRIFARIVRKHVAGGIAIGVDCGAFHEILADSPKHISADVFCMQQAIAELHRIIRGVQADYEPLECTFDQSEGYSPRMLAAWLRLRKKKKALPRHLMASITFADAHYVPALQAADMLSCGITRELRAGEAEWAKDSPFRLMVDSEEGHLPFEFQMWSAAEMRRRKDELLAAVVNNS